MDQAMPQSGIQRKGELINTNNTNPFLERVIGISLGMLFLGFPLFFLGLTFQGIAFEKQLYFYFWLFLGMVAWFVQSILRGEVRIRRTPIDILIVSFLVLVTISAFFSVDRWHSFWGSFGDPSRGVAALVGCILAYYLLLSHFTAKRFYWLFFFVLTSGFFVVLWSLLAIMRVQFSFPIFDTAVLTSFFGTASALTLYLIFLLPLFMTGIFGLWRKELCWRRSLRVVLTLFLGAGIIIDLFLLFVLYSFVSWVAALVGILFFTIYILARIVRPNPKLVWLPMLVFVALLGFLMIGKTTFFQVPLPAEATPGTELSWAIAKSALKEDFLTGAGPGSYGYAFSLYRPAVFNGETLSVSRFYQGQGLFFESLATIGGVGTLLMLFIWLIFFSIGIFLLSVHKEKNKIFSLGLWTAVTMFLLAAFLVTIPGPLIIMAVLLSALAFGIIFFESDIPEQYYTFSLQVSARLTLMAVFVCGLIAIGIVFLGIFLGRVLMADISAGKAVRLSTLHKNTEAAQLLTRATEFYPAEGRYALRLGQEYMALANAEIAKKPGERNESLIAEYVQQSLGRGEESRRRMPNDILVAESVALLYENAALYVGDVLPKVSETYAQAQKLEPHNPLYLVKLANLKRQEADGKKADDTNRIKLYQEAEKLLLTAIQEKDDFAIAYSDLGIVQSRLKKYDEAIRNAEKAATLENRNLTYQHGLAVAYQLRGGEEDLVKAETILVYVVNTNRAMIDAQLSLGLLYERQGKKALALEQYQAVLNSLPNNSEGSKQMREPIERLIRNLQGSSGEAAVPEPPAPTAPESLVLPQAENQP